MSSSSAQVNTSSLGSTLLLIAFIVLKLTGVIDWPWVWVLAPLWVPIAVALVVILFLLALTARKAARR